MLGIRHYKNVALDLWQGEGKSFVADEHVLVTSHSSPLVSPYKKVMEIQKNVTFEDFWNKKSNKRKHFCFVIDKETSDRKVAAFVEDFYLCLQKKLESSDTSFGIRRITLSCYLENHYNLIQQSLFRFFV